MPTVSNWKGDITYHPSKVETPSSVERIIEIVTNERDYPSPVRVKGSHHSVTRCVDADSGTVLDMSKLNKILKIDREAMTITMQAGVMLKDASSILEQLGLQFYVNVEIGNLTMGSGACCGTKKASFFDGAFESGQVSAYVTGMKLVQDDGSILEVDERDPELLAAMRSSYGLLGVVYEVTYKIKKLQPMSFRHEVHTLESFEALLKEQPQTSTMLYIFPFIERIVVERRWADPEGTEVQPCPLWTLRNWAWSVLVPRLGKLISQIPFERVRSTLLNGCFKGIVFVLSKLEGSRSSPEDQIIRYPHISGSEAYTFSLWAFDEQGGEYVDALRDYFEFCKRYHDDHGYRCDMPSVGYRVAQEPNILFSYAKNGFAATIDPVSTGGVKWEKFLDAFNEHCSARDGKPLFNQTPRITHEQTLRAFRSETRAFLDLRAKLDPGDRFYTDWFSVLFTGQRVDRTRRRSGSPTSTHAA